ncbi:MAG: NACHT domain-containing protein, partial [Planctomycetota bacterium]
MKCKFVDSSGKICDRNTQYKWALCESHYNRLTDFQRKVVHLLGRPGFDFYYTAEFSADTKILIQITLGVFQAKVLVHCEEGDHHVTPEQLFQFYGLLKSHPEIHRGMLVASNAFTSETREIAKGLTDLDIFTVDEILSSLIRFDQYLEQLQKELEEEFSSLPFVSPSGKMADGRIVKLSDFLTNWVNEKNSPFLLLLGEEGQGRTTLLKFLARHLVQQLASQKVAPIPFYIPIQKLGSTEKGDLYIIDSLADLYNLSVESFGVLSKVMEQGRILFLLDGLGESLAQVSPKELNQALHNIQKLLHPKGKLVLTGNRSDFYVGDQETELLRKCRELGATPIPIQPFNKLAINTYMEQVFQGSVPVPIQN